MMAELSQWGPLLVYLLTAVAGIATVKVTLVTTRERFEEHLEEDRLTHARFAQELGGMRVEMADRLGRIETKLDHMRKERRP